MRHTVYRGLRVVAAVALVCFCSHTVAAEAPGEQEGLPKIPAEKAKDNIVTFVQPQYPPLAKAARIVGIIRASIEVDENGNTKDVKLISGHPMLAPAALDAIRKWKYRPFEIDGKPSAIRTEVQVSIPENLNQSDIDQEKKFQDAYWPSERAGREALGKGDLATAETKLSLARTAAEERGDQKWLELASVISMLGSVKLQQDNLTEAEQLYKQSLEIHENHQRPDEAEVAGAQESLGVVYMRMRQPEKAEPLFLQSVKSYEARIHSTSMPEPLADYGRSLALGYFALSQIAAADGRIQLSHCAHAVEYAEKWSSTSDKETIVSHCGDLSKAK